MTTIRNGKEVTWMAVAVHGRCVGTFGEDEVAARAFIDKRKEQGVTLRLFCQEVQMTEVDHP